MACTITATRVKVSDLIPHCELRDSSLVFTRPSSVADVVACRSDAPHAIEAAGIFPSLEVFRGEAFAGRVLEVSSRTVQVMSDAWETEYYAIVWDDEAEAPREVSWSGVKKITWNDETRRHDYAYEAGLDHGFGECRADSGYSYNQIYVGTFPGWEEQTVAFQRTDWVADATEDVKSKYEEWKEEQNRKSVVRSRAITLATTLADCYRAATRVRTGVDAVVVKGRKVKVGTEVRVSYAGEGQYGPYANVVTADGKATKFVSAENLRVVPHWPTDLQRVAAYVPHADVLALFGQFLDGQVAWPIVCDRIADLDTGDYTGYEVAQYLRDYCCTNPLNIARTFLFE